MGGSTGVAFVLVLSSIAVSSIVLSSCGDSPPPTEDAGAGCATDDDCDDGVFCNGLERCVGARCVETPACLEGSQECDETTDRCFTRCDATEDADGDGARAIECGGNDCDDANPDRHPGAVELCDVDDVDEDCDPSTYGFRDMDGDGLGDAACCNEGGCGQDCDDGNASVNPRAPEVCNGFDDDCDGSVDEGVLTEFFVDGDGDGFGAVTSEAFLDCRRRPGFSPTATDCDDRVAAINPGAVEVCDGATDEDCSGAVDDVEGGCDCDEGTTQDCGLAGRCEGATQSCSGGRWGMCAVQPIAETCNDVDDDCDGLVDEGQTVRCFFDGDNDGVPLFGAAPSDQCPDPDRAEAPFLSCPRFYTGEAAATAADGDCDDSRALDWVSGECFPDIDGDGYGAGTPTLNCASDPCPAGRVRSNDDCCPNDAKGHPGATGWYDGTYNCPSSDINCNGRTDLRYGHFRCERNGFGGCTGYARRGAPYLRDNVGCGSLSVEVDYCEDVSGTCVARWSGYSGSASDIRVQQCR